ncbi:MAG: radical SAM protein [Spirochaetales bacterium]|nr:radical SAM protein [Spirochaetales bacterium]
MIDYISLKAKLLVDGINADAQSLGGLGTSYKEQNHGLFGWDFEDHVGATLPDDFCLPDGTVVQYRLNSDSPYRVKKTDRKLVLSRSGEELCPVKWIKRPDFYEKRTSENLDMVKIGQIGGEDCLFFCYQNYCSHFGHHNQCLFCNLVATRDTYNSVLKRKEIDAIGEVAAAAWREGTVNHVLLTGGCFSNEKEVDLVSKILSSIRSQAGLDRVPGTILPSPAKGDAIQRYYDTGIQAIGYSMEIWDESLYGAICPGKSAETSHREFVESIKTAVAVFGPGNVYGVFVMGLEPKDTFLEGVRVLSDIGANVVPFVWSPNPGSRLYGHRAPESSWYIDTVGEASGIVAESGVPSGTNNHCYRCDGNSLLHDALRKRGYE